MRLCIALWGAFVLPLLGGGGIALAQTSKSSPDADQRLDQFERRLNEMESKHQAEMKSRDEEIARLREQLDRVRQQQQQPPQSQQQQQQQQQQRQDGGEEGQIEPAQDYQLARAFDLLRGLALFNQKVTN